MYNKNSLNKVKYSLKKIALSFIIFSIFSLIIFVSGCDKINFEIFGIKLGKEKSEETITKRFSEIENAVEEDIQTGDDQDINSSQDDNEISEDIFPP
ncbi:unnamed protein product, partial [marine sediment metagenome]